MRATTPKYLVYNMINSKARCHGKDNVMGVPATKIEFERELRRRQKAYSGIQAKLDVDELNLRVKNVEEGRSKLLTENESEKMLRELGYYD
jgi:hypothetical protein